jgi:toxin-antitoxin system PIN domain toxin
MIVDANILLYATNASSPFHDRARGWLEDAFNGPGRVGLPWASLTAFQRIATNAKASAHPLSPERAWSIISGWLDADNAWIPVPGARHADIFGRLVVDGDLRGNRVTDAHVAALAIENGVGVCSADTDFARFPEVSWINPTVG